MQETVDISRYELIKGTNPTISRGKVRVTVTPLNSRPRLKWAKVYTEIGNQPGASRQTNCYYEQEIPYYISQKNISFKITIENDMELPLRTTKNGEGAIFALQIGNKNISADQYPVDIFAKNSEEWGKLIILPGSSTEIVFEGPFTKYISSATTITLAIYDLATETNDVGDVKKRSSFVWKYNYTKQTEVRQDNVRNTCMCKSAGQTCAGLGGACPTEGQGLGHGPCVYSGISNRPRFELMKKTID